MGFCMETTGMTQGGQGEPPSDLEMERVSIEEPEFQEEAETMEEDQDSEVRNKAALISSVFTECT